jgi:hypothetical protein
MKKFYALFLVLVLSIAAYGNGVAIGGVYYLLDDETLTATVTYPNDTVPVWPSDPSTYSGAITIPDIVTYNNQSYTVTAIGSKAFLGARLTALTLPNTITSIGGAAFYDHRGITSLELPNLQSIGNEAFRFCSSIEKVVIPECINSLGITAFQRCIALREIQLPDKLTSLPNHFLFACSSLEQIQLPASMTFISYECFRSCAALKSISIPEGVTRLNNLAFRGCESLEKLYIPKNVVNIGEEIIGGYPSDPYTGGAVPGATGIDRLKSVFIDCVTPPTCHTNAFLRVDKSKVRLFVPAESVSTYKSIAAYADHFKGIYAFGDDISNVMDISDSSALITWFPNPDVIEYTIKVYTSGQQIAQYVVDGEGNLQSSQRFMPSVYQQKMDTTHSSTDYFVLSVEDLEPGTDYNYSINGVADDSSTIYQVNGIFRTTFPEGFFEPISTDSEKVRKVFLNGQLYILRDDRVYTLTGQALK